MGVLSKIKQIQTFGWKCQLLVALSFVIGSFLISKGLITNFKVYDVEAKFFISNEAFNTVESYTTDISKDIVVEVTELWRIASYFDSPEVLKAVKKDFRADLDSVYAPLLKDLVFEDGFHQHAHLTNEFNKVYVTVNLEVPNEKSIAFDLVTAICSSMVNRYNYDLWEEKNQQYQKVVELNKNDSLSVKNKEMLAKIDYAIQVSKDFILNRQPIFISRKIQERYYYSGDKILRDIVIWFLFLPYLIPVLFEGFKELKS